MGGLATHTCTQVWVLALTLFQCCLLAQQASGQQCGISICYVSEVPKQHAVLQQFAGLAVVHKNGIAQPMYILCEATKREQAGLM